MNNTTAPLDTGNPNAGHQLMFYTDLHKRRVVAGAFSKKVGKLIELVCKLGDSYPEAVGIIVASGGGYPNQFVPWSQVVKVDEDAIFIQPRPDGSRYPVFDDQPGWLLVNDHLMGRTILDLDGRQVEVVNDVHLLIANNRMLIVHVDISFNGWLRRWGIVRLNLWKDDLISWRYVQPLSTENVGSKSDTVTLSVTHKDVKGLPVEDLADALEVLSGDEQEAVFAALNAETAAEVLSDTEPRVQRQLIEDLHQERAGAILEEMTVPQVVDLLAALPHDLAEKMLTAMPEEKAKRVHSLLHEYESPVGSLITNACVALPAQTSAQSVLAMLCSEQNLYDATDISYVYVVDTQKRILGVVDIRDLVLAPCLATLESLASSPVVSVLASDERKDIIELFLKYHFHMIPVCDESDHLLGVVHYNDVMKGQTARPRL